MATPTAGFLRSPLCDACAEGLIPKRGHDCSVAILRNAAPDLADALEALLFAMGRVPHLAQYFDAGRAALQKAGR